MIPAHPPASYTPLEWNVDYQGNAFIEALGDVPEEGAIVQRLTHDPGLSPGAAALSTEKRIHLIESMQRVFFPEPTDIRLAQRLDLLIRQGYLNRNPTAEGYQRFVYQAKARAKELYRNSFASASTTFPALLVYGPSGTGKSTSVHRAVTGLFPEAIQHEAYAGQALPWLQIPVVRINAPFNGTPRGLILEFFREIDRITRTSTYWDDYCNAKGNVEALVGNMGQICATFAVGAIVIDEIQHMQNYRQGANGAEGTDFVLKLSNALQVPIVFVGTYSALKLLHKFQNARRVCAMGSVEFPLPADVTDPTWKSLRMPRIWRYQWTRDTLPFTPEVARWFFDLTQGVHSLDVLLPKLVQQRAARSGKRTVTQADFVAVYASELRPLHPVMQALSRRARDPSALEQYEDLLRPSGGLSGLLAGSTEVPQEVAKPAADNPAGEGETVAGTAEAPPAPQKTRKKSPKEPLAADDLRGIVVDEDVVEGLRRRRLFGLER